MSKRDSIDSTRNDKKHRYSSLLDSSSDEDNELELLTKRNKSSVRKSSDDEPPYEKKGWGVPIDSSLRCSSVKKSSSRSSGEIYSDLPNHQAKSTPINLTNDSDDDSFDRTHVSRKGPTKDERTISLSDSDDDPLCYSAAFKVPSNGGNELLKENRCPYISCSSTSSSTPYRYKSKLKNTEDFSSIIKPRHPLKDPFVSARKISPVDRSPPVRRRSNLFDSNTKKQALKWDDSSSDSNDSIPTRLKRIAHKKSASRDAKESFIPSSDELKKTPRSTTKKHSRSKKSKPFKNPLALKITKYNSKQG